MGDAIPHGLDSENYFGIFLNWLGLASCTCYCWTCNDRCRLHVSLAKKEVFDFLVSHRIFENSNPKPHPHSSPDHSCRRKINCGKAKKSFFPEQIISPCRVRFSNFNYLDSARNSFELCGLKALSNCGIETKSTTFIFVQK